MAALSAASWTVVITREKIQNGYKEVVGTMAIPGTDTYPTGGIPLPVAGVFGFRRNMDSLELWGVNVSTTQFYPIWDKANNKLLLAGQTPTAAGAGQLPLDEMDAAEVPGARTWNFRATGW